MKSIRYLFFFSEYKMWAIISKKYPFYKIFPGPGLYDSVHGIQNNVVVLIRSLDENNKT